MQGTSKGRAFGLDVSSAFEVPGLGPVPDGAGGRPVTIELDSAAEVAARMPADGCDRISDRPGFSIDAHPQAGYLLTPRTWGVHWISAAGDRIACAPPVRSDGPDWRRVVAGQLLPFAALLSGLEVFHASAVALDGRGLAIVAASGTGKTTLAAELVLAGATFLADDVVALEQSGSGTLAHGGTGLANVRHSAAGVADRMERLGTAAGSDEEASQILLDPHPAPVPLDALCLLTRAPEATELRIARPEPVDPRVLLASTFNFVITSPERQIRLLDICARVARGVVLHVEIPPDSRPEDTARALADVVRAAWAQHP